MISKNAANLALMAGNSFDLCFSCAEFNTTPNVFD